MWLDEILYRAEIPWISGLLSRICFSRVGRPRNKPQENEEIEQLQKSSTGGKQEIHYYKEELQRSGKKCHTQKPGDRENACEG